MRPRRLVASIVSGTLICLALIPYSSPHSPDWKVAVIDKFGRPIPGVTVRLSFENYSAEDESHEIDQITDSEGVARFPRRTLHASLVRRCYYTVMAARAGVHASFGPYASVVAFGNGMEASALDSKGNVLFWRGEPSQIESRIVMKNDSL